MLLLLLLSLEKLHDIEILRPEILSITVFVVYNLSIATFIT